MPRKLDNSKTAKPGVITPLTFKDGGKEYPYWLYVPRQADAKEPAPLILFLHGSGEREEGKKGPHEVGLPPAIKKQGEDFPFYVLIPQFGRQGSWRASGPDAKRAMAILEQVMKDHAIDAKRLYLTGLSMGGNGTWEFATAYPKQWAAIAPVCGFVTGRAVDLEKVKLIKDLPCWCFHGDKDSAVPVAQSRNMVAALWVAGGHPNYTEYPGVEHNCWDLAYSDPQLYRWFLEFRLR